MLDIFPTNLCDFKTYQKILNLIIFRFASGTPVSQEKDIVFKYNIYIHDKVRV